MSDDQSRRRVKYFVPQKVDYIAYETEEEVHRALIEVLVFVVFLTVTTILAFNCQNIYEYYTNESYRRIFINPTRQEHFTWQIQSVTNIEDWWYYLISIFFGKFNSIVQYPNDIRTKETDPIGLHTKPRFWGVNILLQPVRLRQIRVKPKKCEKHDFLKEYKTCYGKYSPADQSNEPFHKGTKYMDTKNSDIRSVWATIETYSGGGYIENIPIQQTDFVLRNLQNENWIDRGTRFVELTMETLNYNLGMFSIIKLITEVMPTGNVVCAFYTSVIPLESIWSLNNPSMVITACIFYIIVIFNMGHEISEIITFGIRNYLRILWSYIDWGIIITAYISLGSSIAHEFLVTKYLRDIENENELASLDTIEFYDTIYKAAIALCTVQLWIRIFRFITFNTTMLHLSMALRRCAPEIFGFALILVISFTIFAFVGLLGFGTKHPDFATFTESFFFMFRLMLHDFDYHHFSNVEPFWAPIYLICYVLIVLFILVNMFLAIISQTYIDVKQAAEERPIAIKDVFVNFVNKIRDFLKRTAKEINRISKISISPERFSQKKIQFAEETNLPESETDSKENLPRRLSENEALQDFFGVKYSVSVTSLVDTDMQDFETDEAANEAKRQTTFEFLSRLHERLDLLEKGFTQLRNDIDTLLSKFERKAQKTMQ